MRLPQCQYPGTQGKCQALGGNEARTTQFWVEKKVQVLLLHALNSLIPTRGGTYRANLQKHLKTGQTCAAFQFSSLIGKSRQDFGLLSKRFAQFFKVWARVR